jgi:hypothetical protein
MKLYWQLPFTSLARGPAGCFPHLPVHLFASSIDQGPKNTISFKSSLPEGLGCYQWEISLHSADESLTIQFWCYNCGFALACATEEPSLLDPSLEFLVQGIGADVI